MALESDILFLSKVPLFAGFSADHLRLLAFGSENMKFSSGRTIFREGDAADCAYVVIAGTVRLSQIKRGQPVAIREISSGAALGELALLAQTNRAVTAQTVGDVETIRIGRSLVRRILEEYPELAAGMYREISTGLRSMIRDITNLDKRFAS
jgi:CRP-like cAMP-binding protein